MSAAAAVPMNPEGFRAMVARYVRNWGRKTVAMVKKTGNVVTRAARRLHVTQAVRWTAGMAGMVAGKAWHYAKIPIMLAAPPIAAVVFAPQFVVVMLGLMTLMLGITGFWLWRLHKELKKKAPEETAGLIEDLRQRLRDAQEEAEELRRTRASKSPEPEPEREDEPDIVEGVVVEETSDGVFVVEEPVVERIHDMEAARDEAAAKPFPDPPEDKTLPVPYPILQARWTELTKLAEEAFQAEDEDLFSEITGRLAVVMARTGHPDNKVTPNASWSDIHRDNRRNQESEMPDYPWNWERMTKGSQKEVTLLNELRDKAKDVA